jgi:8-amino-7-oxononanoate synthase
LTGETDRFHGIRREIEELRAQRRLRTLREVQGPPGRVLTIEGRRVLNLSSNDYLGLADDPRVRRAAAEAIAAHGCGATASRLVCGNLRIHEELEEEIAGWKGTERALVFSSGYAANVGIISALVGPGDVVLSDRLNHASIVDGIRLSGARLLRYRHADPDALAERLRRAEGRRRLIVTDSVFSMDGDIEPLREIAELAERSGALLMVDEAHAAGIFGPGGAGIAAEVGVSDRVDIAMGTLSKAFGSAGGYVAGRRDLIELLVQRARSFMFSTGPSPAAIGGAREALRIASEEPERRRLVLESAIALRSALHDMNLRVPEGRTPIIPVLLGEEGTALEFSGALFERGILAIAIRPPAVPAGGARLRVSVSAAHTPEDIRTAVAAFAQVTRAREES